MTLMILQSQSHCPSTLPELELIDMDPPEGGVPLRRSTRNRREPDRYQPMVVHQVTEFGTNSSEEVM